jgi:hypothetical protein
MYYTWKKESEKHSELCCSSAHCLNNQTTVHSGKSGENFIASLVVLC